MKPLIISSIIGLFAYLFVTKANEISRKNSSSVSEDNRTSKFFPVLSFVRFVNSECVGDDLRNGTCFNYAECKKLGGFPLSTCASNLGSCCIFQDTCGGSIAVDNAHFLNPSYPNKDAILPVPCTLQILIPKGTCQVLLRLLEFNVSQPDHDTVCRKDRMWFSQYPSLPTICGSNFGQHTPVGCLQYFGGRSGTVTSFNFYDVVDYDDYEEMELVVPPCATHLAFQNYAICIKKFPGVCKIEWQAETFELSNNETCLVADRGDACQTDYIMIPLGNIGDEIRTYDRYCGFALNVRGATTSAIVESASLPFEIRVVTDGNEAMDENNRGFRLNFRQIRCEDC